MFCSFMMFDLIVIAQSCEKLNSSVSDWSFDSHKNFGTKVYYFRGSLKNILFHLMLIVFVILEFKFYTLNLKSLNLSCLC